MGAGRTQDRRRAGRRRPGPGWVGWLVAGAGLLLCAGAGMLLCVSGCARRDRTPHIVLVILDTVRRDAAGFGDSIPAGWLGVTPELHRLAAEGTVFASAWATAPWTVPSHASIFTGLLPLTHRCVGRHPRLEDDVGPTLAELLADAGYETAAFYSNPWLADRTSGLLRGFQVRQESPIGGLADLTSASGDQGGRRTIENVAGWLETRDARRPFFLFVNILEPHLPYDPPAAYRRERLPDLADTARTEIMFAHEYNAGLHAHEDVDWDEVRALYGGDVHTADRLLGELISILRDRGLYEDAVLIVTSDHGENLGDHGLMDHQFSVHETLLGVPLVIRAPGVLPAGRREEPVMLADLYPTILELAGAGSRAPASHGRSLLREDVTAAGERPIFADYGRPGRRLLELLRDLNPALEVDRLAAAWRTVRLGDFRLSAASDGTLQLHDVARDPAQRHDISRERPELVTLLTRLLAQSQAEGRGEIREEELHLDPQTREQLRSLGYIR